MAEDKPAEACGAEGIDLGSMIKLRHLDGGAAQVRGDDQACIPSAVPDDPPPRS